MLFCRLSFPPWHKTSKNLWDHGPREDEGFRRLSERVREPFRGREDRTSFPEHICVLHSSAGRIRARCPLPVSSRLLHPASPLRLAPQRIARWPTPSRKLILSFRLRGKAAGVTRRMRAERLSPEDLRQPAPLPSVASNGVRWLEISAWNRPAMRSAIWHGFSTRAGGLSSCYVAEGAPGELNLGFTASDERQTVAANRRLLIEAVTGDPATPLVTLRQVHSSVLVLGSSEC